MRLVQVAYLEQLVAQSTEESRYMQAPMLHTGLPVAPLPSPQIHPEFRRQAVSPGIN